MALNPDFKETVREHVARKPASKATRDEVSNAFSDGDQGRSQADERWLRELDESIERGLNDIKAGRLVDATKVFDHLEARYKRMAAERAAE